MSQEELDTATGLHINAFFAGFPSFEYDASKPIMNQYHALSGQLNFGKNKTKKTKKQLREAMVLQFNDYYGTDVDDINAWKAMCEILDIDPIPDELKACRSLVKAAHVNIVDYIEAKRLGIRVRKFATVKELAVYTYKEDKVFPLGHAKAGGVLRFLLRKIFAAYTYG